MNKFNPALGRSTWPMIQPPIIMGVTSFIFGKFFLLIPSRYSSSTSGSLNWSQQLLATAYFSETSVRITWKVLDLFEASEFITGFLFELLPTHLSFVLANVALKCSWINFLEICEIHWLLVIIWNKFGKCSTMFAKCGKLTEIWRDNARSCKYLSWNSANFERVPLSLFFFFFFCEQRARNGNGKYCRVSTKNAKI